MFAGAAFTDEADINDVNKEAVSTLVELGVINGYKDGTFRPNEIVTRAEMAKMIYVVRTGKSSAEAYNDDPTSFTDIGSHWARGYIKYCQALGVIAGKNATTFDPDATVTTQEASKMLLVTLGYNAERAKLIGKGWGQRTIALADENGLLKDVNCGATQGMNRQYAAQLIFNAIDAETVVYRDEQYTNTNAIGEKNDTIGEKYMDLYKNTGILTEVKEDSKGTYSIAIAADSSDDYKDGRRVSWTKVKADYSDLLGQEVKVLYKDSDDVFGAYATDENEIAIKATAGVLDSLKKGDKTIKVDGDKYDLNTLNGVYVVENGKVAIEGKNGEIHSTGASIESALVDASDAYKVNTASTVYLVSNDGDSKIDTIVVIEAEVAKVNYVGSDSITLANGIGTIDEGDFAAYEGMKKGDYVVYTKEDNGTAYVDDLAKVEVVSGTIDAVKNTTEAKIDGTYYKQGTGCTDTPKANDKVTAVVYGNRYYDLDATSEASADDLLFVVEAGKISSGINSGVEASVLFADGTSETIVIDSIYKPEDDEADVDATAVDVLKDANKANYAAGTNGTVYVGGLYTFDKDGSKYDLTPVKQDDNDAGYDNVDINATGSNVFTNDNDNPRLDNKRIDDSAVIFVSKKMTAATGADAKVITGKELKAWDGKTGAVAQTLSNSKNGVKTVMVGSLVISGDSYGSEAGKYGIITSDPETVKVNGSSYQSFNLWNGSEDVKTIAKSSEMNGAVKGDVVSFDTDGSEGDLPKIKNLDKITAKAAMLGAETNGSKLDVTLVKDGETLADQDILTADSDTTVLFISEKTGVQGGSLTDYAAMESSIDDVFVQNALYVAKANKANELDLIVIDVRGKLNMNKDLADKDDTHKVDFDKKTIELANGSTADVATVESCFDNVLAVSKLSDSKFTVVADDGSEYTFTVTVAK